MGVLLEKICQILCGMSSRGAGWGVVRRGDGWRVM